MTEPSAKAPPKELHPEMLTVLQTSRSYDSATIFFHWMTVFLVLGQWLGAHTIDWFPRGGPRTDVRSLHILFGVVLAGIILSRLAWRWRWGTRLPPADTGMLRNLAALVHGLLYVLVVTTVALGILNTFARGDNIFGLFTLPKLALAHTAKAKIDTLHVLCANAILFVAGVHGAAALWHQYLRRDGGLARMIPALNGGRTEGRRSRW